MEQTNGVVIYASKYGKADTTDMTTIHDAVSLFK